MMVLKKTVAMAALAFSGFAFAHGDMGKTYPADGAMMMEPTEHVELHFEMPMALLKLRVIDSSGKPVAIDFTRSKEMKEHFKVMMPTLAPDNYKVEWKAMGEDGHSMNGSFGFMQH